MYVTRELRELRFRFVSNTGDNHNCGVRIERYPVSASAGQEKGSNASLDLPALRTERVRSQNFKYEENILREYLLVAESDRS